MPISSLLREFSDTQTEAVMHRIGAMLVSAGPGSGKTTVLTGRILAMLLEEAAKQQDFCVITFTKDAALSMQNRFRNKSKQWKITDSPGKNISFSTFHSLYYQILKSHQSFQNYQLISNESQMKLLQYLTEKYVPDAYGKVQRNTIEQVKSAIGYYKNTLKHKAYEERLPITMKEYGQQFLADYQRELEHRNCFDMDDLIYRVESVLEFEEIRKRWQSKFKHFMVDEFQDCNPLQYRILKILAQESESLFVVGDEDQSIYGFRGAEARIMQEFREDYPNAHQVLLGENYRSYPEIVGFSDRVISACPNREHKVFIPKVAMERNDGDPVVDYQIYHSRKEEWAEIYRMLQVSSKEELARTVVLFRTNILLATFSNGLARYHIPYVRMMNQSIYEHFAVKDIMAYLKAAYGDRSRSVWVRMLNAPRIGVGRECLWEEYVDTDKMEGFYTKGAYASVQTVNAIRKLRRNLEQIKRMNLRLAVLFIRKACGYDNYINSRFTNQPEYYESTLEVLDYLEMEADDYTDLESWLKEQENQLQKSRELASTNQKEIANNEKKDEPQGLHVMTMHSAKGLEFDRVIIPDVNEGIIPKIPRQTAVSQDLIEEERRLFYVAITRARKKLVLTAVHQTQGKPSFPSRFLPD